MLLLLAQKYQLEYEDAIENKYHLQSFMKEVAMMIKPYDIKRNQIMLEEETQFSRKVNLNGITFEKETIMAKELKIEARKLCKSKGKSISIKENKPLALMTSREIQKLRNTVTYNGKEVSPNILSEIKQRHKDNQKDFEQGTISKSIEELDGSLTQEERIDDLFYNLEKDTR